MKHSCAEKARFFACRLRPDCIRIQCSFTNTAFQADTGEEPEDIETRLREAAAEIQKQRGASCCYAVGEKSRTFDPEDIAWETFLITGTYEEYGPDRRPIVGRGD